MGTATMIEPGPNRNDTGGTTPVCPCGRPAAYEYEARGTILACTSCRAARNIKVVNETTNERFDRLADELVAWAHAVSARLPMGVR